MSTYTKITDFAAKDALLTGNPSKIVKGTEIGAEFDSIATADASNVKGPTSSVTDNAVVRWDTTTGRISQGSSVTIDDSGNISGTSFSGAHNGTVGATTPSTGAFTTLSASSTTSLLDNVTIKKTSGLVEFRQADNSRTGYIQENLGSLAVVGERASSVVDIYANNTKITTVSSTGLSVTGALSASGGASLASPVNTDPVLAMSGSGAYNSRINMNGSSVGGIVNVLSGGHLYTQIASSTVTDVSSTGLAVTGALSATGNLTSGDGTGNSNVTLNSLAGSSNQINWQKAGVTRYAMGRNVGSGGADDLSIYDYTLGTTIAQFTAGNLGLGVTPSAWGTNYKALQIGLTSTISNSLTDDGLELVANGRASATGVWNYLDTYGASRYRQSNSSHYWYTAPSGTAGNAITFTQAMTLDVSGRLIIGGTSTLGPGKANIYFAGATEDGIDIKNSNGSNTGSFFGFFNSAGSVIGSVTQSGASAVLYNTTSDYRLKTVIAPVSGSGARIDALNPVEYAWKADGTRTRGFLAHEFQAVYAQSVNGTKDAVDADGNPVYQSMQAGSSEVIADLVAEIKSLRARLNAAGIA